LGLKPRLIGKQGGATVLTENLEIQQAILRYVDVASPDYAIMLDGPWGSGKTHFWKNSIAPGLKEQGWNPLYVSLYGVQRLLDIDYQILYSLHPIFQNRFVKFGGRLAQLGFERIGGGVAAVELMSFSKKAVLCFDDLERIGGLTVASVLGYVNRFAEHDGLRAIVIANETELMERKEEGYSRTKEKVIGRTYRYRPDVDAAAEGLVDGYRSNSRVFPALDPLRHEFASIFKSARVPNIRALKHAIDSAALLLGLAKLDKSDMHNTAISSFVRLLCAVTAESKADEVNAKQLSKLFGDRANLQWLFYLKDRKETDDKDSAEYLHLFVDRYFDGNLDAVPNLPSLVPFVADGLLNQEAFLVEFREYCTQTVTPQKTLQERLVSDLWHMSDVEVTRAATEVFDALSALRVRHPAELLRLMTVLHYCAKKAAIEKSTEEVVDAFSTALRALDESRQLVYDELLSTDFGFQIDANAPKELKDFSAELFRIGKRYQGEKAQKEVAEFFESMPKDPRRFCVDISAWNTESPGRYVTTPVFAQYDPVRVADLIQSLEASDIVSLSSAFSARYLHIANSQSYLGPEYENLKTIREALVGRHSFRPRGLHKAALDQFIQRLDEVLRKMQPTAGDQSNRV
jgi:hypothetical protein